MPTYDFRCPGGHEFEKFFRKISDAPAEVACPECGQAAARLVSGGAGLLFRGSGFYLTDYGKNAHRKGAAAGDATKGEGKTDGAKTESKPAESKGEAKAPESKPAKPSKPSGSGEA